MNLTPLPSPGRERPGSPPYRSGPTARIGPRRAVWRKALFRTRRPARCGRCRCGHRRDARSPPFRGRDRRPEARALREASRARDRFRQEDDRGARAVRRRATGRLQSAFLVASADRPDDRIAAVPQRCTNGRTYKARETEQERPHVALSSVPLSGGPLPPCGLRTFRSGRMPPSGGLSSRPASSSVIAGAAAGI
jgi:hypothetical protein